MSGPRRVAVVVSHPIQYYVTLYRALARSPELELRVFFASRFALEETFDPEMKVKLAWATNLTDGYPHEFLPEAPSINEISFRAVDNPSIGAALSQFRPQAVIIHGYAMLTALRALFWSRRNGVKAILASDSSAHGAPPGLRRWAKLAIVPLLLRQFGAALTMSDRAEAHLQSLKYPLSRMFRTPVMIDEGFWRARENRAAIRAAKRAELGMSEDDFVLLAVGKLHPRKRMIDVVEALARVRGARRCTLLIGGDGEEREWLQNRAVAHGLDVRFLGFVNIDALPSLYSAADLFVHCPEIEQYGLVALEAAVLGLPMTLSDRVGAIGPTSIARANVNALVTPFGDIGALAAAIERLRDDESLRQEMARASLQISEDHRGPNSVAAVIAASA